MTPEPTLEECRAELARVEAETANAFLVLPEGPVGHYMEGLRAAIRRKEKEASPPTFTSWAHIRGIGWYASDEKYETAEKACMEAAEELVEHADRLDAVLVVPDGPEAITPYNFPLQRKATETTVSR